MRKDKSKSCEVSVADGSNCEKIVRSLVHSFHSLLLLMPIYFWVREFFFLPRQKVTDARKDEKKSFAFQSSFSFCSRKNASSSYSSSSRLFLFARLQLFLVDILNKMENKSKTLTEMPSVDILVRSILVPNEFNRNEKSRLVYFVCLFCLQK